ncbi:MAG: T9SS type A sorting domain-containing protein [Crocinitomicaceae bacterium]|nr:T9SS type A sorting domain-containing protein [Flavobacteriales bacterium]NQZ37753.1 T9SS type A sorting domain-containing protein [Crocinitomicaceae bacterium]
MLRNFFIRSCNSIYNTLKATSVKTILGAIFIVVAFSSSSQQIQISIGSPVDAVEGSGGDISFIVFLEGGGVNNTGSSITGSLTFTGTATNGTDYVGPASFSIPNGVNSTAVIVTVVDDAIIEPTETVIASLSLTSIGVIVTATSTANIYDDDAGSIFISIGLPVDAVEGTSDISFDVFIEGGGLNTTGAPITGNITLSGTASNTTDYVGVSTFVIPIGANSTTISIVVLDDILIECTETVVATILNPNFGSINTATSIANIIDDECILIISIGSPMDGTEGLSDVSYDVFLEGGAINTTGSPIVGTISYAGIALIGLDISSAPSTFSIPNGSNSTTIVLSVIDDILLECNESILAIISAPNIGTIGNASSTATIIDDECAQASISIGVLVNGEEGVSDVSFVISLDGGLVNETGSPIFGTINYAGTATASLDFVDNSTFSIPVGASFFMNTLPVIDDILLECDETIIATISNPNIGSIGTATSTALIIDDECAQASISIGTPVDGEEGVSDISFIISLDGGLVNGTGSAITGTIGFSGTATLSVDFVDNSIFSIPNGASFVIHDISVYDDLNVELAESVIAMITTVSIGTISAIFVDTAYILDNDSTTGFKELNLNALSVEIYPNPVSSTLNLASEQQMKSYSIVDLNGRVMTTGELKTNQFALNVGNLPKGFYIIRVELEDGSLATKKVLKQ